MASQQGISAATAAHRQQRLPTLTFVASMSVTYRRLLFVCCLPPLIVLTAPLCASGGLKFVNVFTQDHGLLFSILVILLLHIARRLIVMYAPTKRKAETALSQSRLWLPLLSALITQVAIRYAIAPIGAMLGVTEYLQMTPNFHFKTMLRVSTGTLLLGLAIVSRYVGPVSVVRCSSVPLISHPMTSSIRSIWTRCTSMDAILDIIAGPDNPEQARSIPPNLHNCGRRYQRWTNRAAIGQTLVSALFGTSVAYTTVLGWYHAPQDSHEHTEPFIKTALVATCLLTTLFHLFSTALDGKSHEMNPRLYHSRTGQEFLTTLKLTLRPGNLVSSVLRTVFVVPLVSIGAMFWATDKSVSDTRTGDLTNLGLVCISTTLVISILLTAIDEAAKVVLCVPGLKLKKLMIEILGESTPDLCLDLVLNSMLHGDALLVRNIWSATERADRSDEEVRRNDSCIDQMAHTLLHKGDGSTLNTAGLEQDILRSLVLESLGGVGDKVNNTDDSLLAKALLRHVESVKFWVEPATSKWVRREPAVIPLVRGLCAYAGGMGEALVTCTSSNVARKSQMSWQQQGPSVSLKDCTPYSTWSLPPGAICCAEYAIRGAARCVVLDLASSGKFMGDWRNSSLSIMVPSVLHSAFRLSCGIQSYALYLQRIQSLTIREEDNLNWIAIHKPELRRLLLSCDDAAIMILESLKSVDALRVIETRVQSGCRDWVQQLQSQLNNR